ncbi:twin-arginine translocase subunit TatB [Ectothiorhodospiraceae bacterium BW-2]|nr:twin-arginine translocase subunit TatB [Ectothiorhodospiraceae bacterium BW-2]
MFDISFWEMIVVAIVALLVIGPERLPGVARKAGYWFGKMRRFVNSVKQDIDREFKAEELQRIIREQAQSNPLHEIMEEGSALKRELEVWDDVADEASMKRTTPPKESEPSTPSTPSIPSTTDATAAPNLADSTGATASSTAPAAGNSTA